MNEKELFRFQEVTKDMCFENIIKVFLIYFSDSLRSSNGEAVDIDDLDSDQELPIIGNDSLIRQITVKFNCANFSFPHLSWILF